MEKSNDLIKKQTNDLQACSIVPQPTMLRMPLFTDGLSTNKTNTVIINNKQEQVKKCIVIKLKNVCAILILKGTDFCCT
jgi:hypothetical protein